MSYQGKQRNGRSRFHYARRAQVQFDDGKSLRRKEDRLTKNYKHIEYEICSGGGEDVHIKKGTPR